MEVGKEKIGAGFGGGEVKDDEVATGDGDEGGGGGSGDGRRRRRVTTTKTNLHSVTKIASVAGTIFARCD